MAVGLRAQKEAAKPLAVAAGPREHSNAGPTGPRMRPCRGRGERLLLGRTELADRIPEPGHVHSKIMVNFSNSEANFDEISIVSPSKQFEPMGKLIREK